MGPFGVELLDEGIERGKRQGFPMKERTKAYTVARC